MTKPLLTVMKTLVAVLSGLCVLGVTHAGTSPTFVNTGLVDTPIVDATNVLNKGTISINTTDIPWDTQNTRNFTNIGRIVGSVGVRLDSLIGSEDTGYRRGPLSNFFNSGNITIADGGGLVSAAVGTGGGNSFNFFIDDRSYLLVKSDTIRSSGSLEVGAAGLLSLTGAEVDLSGGSVVVTPVGALEGSNAFGGFFLSSSNFIPSVGVHDVGWAIGTTTNFFPGSILGVSPAGLVFRSPFVALTNTFGSCGDSISVTNGSVYSFASSPSSTQVVYQVIAVKTTDPAVKTRARFSSFTYANASQPTDYATLYVELSTKATNLVTRGAYTNTIYVIDQMGALTNAVLVDNIREGTPRPANFIFTRSQPFDFEFAASSNIVFDPGFFSGTGYSNFVVNNTYAAYAAQVESSATRLPALSDVGYTNAAGRVEINAGKLNLDRTRIRAEGLVSISTTNLVSSSKAVIDAAHFSMHLASATGILPVANLTLPTVQRFEGPVICYSSVWTNVFVPTLIDPTDTNSPNIEVKVQLLIVDASDLHSTVPVQIHELSFPDARANSAVTISDRLNVEQNFQISSERLTIDGGLVLGSSLDWTAAIAPNLINLTNNGLLQIGNQANFGEDRPGLPYVNWVNRGRVHAFAHSIDTDYFENSGFIGSTQNSTVLFTNFCLGTLIRFTNSFETIGAISINARNQALFNGGGMSTLGQVQFSGPVWKFNNASVSADLGIIFDVPGTLTDPGERGTPNSFSTLNGFELRNAGTRGDLLGSVITSGALDNQQVDHVWASANLGSGRSAFDNNVALGKVILQAGEESRYRFNGLQDGPSYALYVDSLELRGASFATSTLVQDNLNIGSDFTIYVGEIVGPPGTESEISAELLDGTTYGGGKIVWARNFAGTYGGTDALIGPDGPVIRVNRTLRNSLRIDTDADGIPNGLQEFPFKPITMLNLTENVVTGKREVKFYGAGGVAYELQFSSDLASNVWTTVSSFTVPGEGRQLTTLADPTSNGVDARFYRVVYAP